MSTSNGSSAGTSMTTCGCCGKTGSAATAGVVTVNRPGLPAISFRAGTHASFVAAMQARLSAADLPALARLKTRQPNDFAIALLDGWSMIGDVLTFYQERIANEGYIRTATERFSVVELARMIGFELRPGVAASAFLAWTLNDSPDEFPIPAGSPVKTVPGPGETPQTFETAETLRARSEWNQLLLRMSQAVEVTKDNALSVDTLNFAGAALNLKPGDRLLFVFDDANPSVANTAVRQIATVQPLFKDDPANPLHDDRTTVTLVEVPRLTDRVKLAEFAESQKEDDDLRAFAQQLRFGASDASLKDRATVLRDRQDQEDSTTIDLFNRFINPQVPGAAPEHFFPFLDIGSALSLLRKQSSSLPRSAADLNVRAASTFSASSDAKTQVVKGLTGIGDTIYLAFTPPPKPIQSVFVFRQAASLFGSNAPNRQLIEQSDSESSGDWPVDTDSEKPTRLFLDNGYPAVVAGDFVFVESATLQPPGSGGVILLRSTGKVNTDVARPAAVAPAAAVAASGSATTGGALLSRVDSVTVHNRTAYHLSGPTTQLELLEGRWTPDMPTIRSATVLTRTEELQLARNPITDPVGFSDEPNSTSATRIELARVYPGLTAGRRIIVSGLRSSGGTADIPGAEVVMIAGVEQSGLLPDGAARQNTDTDPHTILTLAGDGLAFTYRRDSVKIFGNVVLATHGETRAEVLGNGDATQPLQTFKLKKPPLTYIPAPTTSGIASTLHVAVNDIIWREAPSLAGLGPADRRYIVRAADDGTVSVTFGTGAQGARLPTGAENVKAVYRSGIGRPGNVKADQISLLASRPLGVKEVTNPLPSSGGADPDTRDEARRNAPESVTALDRLVSVKDYGDFSRSFAGIAKATSERIIDPTVPGARPEVRVVVAAQDDAPIASDSLLFTSLLTALHTFGDPSLPVKLDVSGSVFLVISAAVRIGADRVWEAVSQQIRATLFDLFSFDRRDLGQRTFLSEVIAAIQNVDGVDYVDVDILTGVSQQDITPTADDLAQDPPVTVTDKLNTLLAALASKTTPDPVVPGVDRNAADQVTYLASQLPDLLLLREIV